MEINIAKGIINQLYPSSKKDLFSSVRELPIITVNIIKQSKKIKDRRFSALGL